MTTSRFTLLAVLALLASSLSGCAAIGGIFKGGIWVGAIGLFLIVFVIWWLVAKMGGGSGPGDNAS